MEAVEVTQPNSIISSAVAPNLADAELLAMVARSDEIWPVLDSDKVSDKLVAEFIELERTITATPALYSRRNRRSLRQLAPCRALDCRQSLREAATIGVEPSPAAIGAVLCGRVSCAGIVERRDPAHHEESH
jgi:hypothetical protein